MSPFIPCASTTFCPSLAPPVWLTSPTAASPASASLPAPLTWPAAVPRYRNA
ncbi:hypothetical protein GBAR_LOCUS29595 [Geodia barretti]|uniref:Uncharacterized protein n=1 Tax=Geodia barretti TaxID=519541 RepID=A0AA35TUG9_GEOBA|nr:hypothetical protein GBAR_LOCUS29595 [Geodia barretti]